MKPYYFVLTILFLISCGQHKTPSNTVSTIKPSKTFDHIQHIKANSRKRNTEEREKYDIPDYFVDYVIENLLEKPEHKKYITDRKLLRKLTNKTCWDNHVLIKDTLTNGNTCIITIKTKAFVPEEHQIVYNANSTENLTLIDGKRPYGALYKKYPSKKILSLRIRINGRELDTQLNQYNNIYEPDFCEFGGHRRATEAYEDGDNIYVYLFGGNAANGYFAKLIFDKSGYVTSIITDYVPLSIYGSFHENFIGY